MNREEVIETLEIYDLDADEFFEWMNGQTVGVNFDGTVDVYEVDVVKYINWKVYGIPYQFD